MIVWVLWGRTVVPQVSAVSRVHLNMIAAWLGRVVVTCGWGCLVLGLLLLLHSINEFLV